MNRLTDRVCLDLCGNQRPGYRPPHTQSVAHVSHKVKDKVVGNPWSFASTLLGTSVCSGKRSCFAALGWYDVPP